MRIETLENLEKSQFEKDEKTEEEPGLKEIMTATFDAERKINSFGNAKKRFEIRKETGNFKQQFEAAENLEVVEKNKLIEKIKEADIIYVSDFHSSPHHGDIIRFFINSLPADHREIIIGLEMLDRRENPLTVPKRKYTKKDIYQGNLGIDHNKYLEIIEDIKKRNQKENQEKIKIIGLGNPEDRKEDIQKENKIVSRKTAELIYNYPNSQIILFYGENHLAENRIPKLIKELLPEKKEKRKELFIYYDIPPLYFRFLEKHQRPPRPGEIVEIKPNTYCIFTEHPLKRNLRSLYSLLNGKNPREIDLHEEKIKELVKNWRLNGWSPELFE